MATFIVAREEKPEELEGQESASHASTTGEEEEPKEEPTFPIGTIGKEEEPEEEPTCLAGIVGEEEEESEEMEVEKALVTQLRLSHKNQPQLWNLLVQKWKWKKL